MRLADYTEVDYAHLSDLDQDLVSKVIEYRDVYRRELPNGYYVACDRLLRQVYHIYDLFLHYSSDEIRSRQLVHTICSRLPYELKKEIDSLFDMELSQALGELRNLFHDEDHKDYLFMDVNVVFKLLYVLEQYLQCASVYCFLLLVLLLKKERLLCCVVLFQPKDLKDLVFTEDEDKTYAYLQILAWMKKQLLKDTRCSIEQMVEYYPHLQRGQIAFYLEHQKPNCYYTIQQYMACNGVCYETGRMQMGQLVTLGWYKKEKVGKKFVYSI